MRPCSRGIRPPCACWKRRATGARAFSYGAASRMACCSIVCSTRSPAIPGSPIPPPIDREWSVRGEEELADDLPRLQQPVGLGGLGQGQHAGDCEAELSLLDLAQEILPDGAPRFGANILAQTEGAHLEGSVVEPVGIDRRGKAAGVSVAHEVAVMRQGRQAQL